MKVFLFDYRSRHAQAIIYSLTAHGYEVVVGTANIPSYHFGVSAFVHWDGNVDSLVALLHQQDIRIVMPISIEAFRFCSRQKPYFSDHGVRLLVADYGTWLRLYNKAQTYELAARYGIPVPVSVAVSQADYRDQIRRAGLQFKLVIKGAEEGGARFVRYADSIDDCEAIFRDFLSQDAGVFAKGVLAQELHIAGTGCAYFCLADEGRVLAEFGHRRIHQNPPAGGVSTCCATFWNDEMFELGRRIVNNERYSGPCMIEFKHDSQKDRFVLIEVNPKFWGSSLLPILCGLNFPVLYVQHLLGEQLGQFTIQDKTLQFVVPDLMRALRNPSCLTEFLKMLLHSGVTKDISYFGVLRYANYYVRR